MKKFAILSMSAFISFGFINNIFISDVKASSIEKNSNTFYSNIDLEEVKNNLTSLGIDEETQNKLINKLINGEVWDSLNPKCLEKVPKSFFNISFDNPINRYEFPDGSVIEVGIKFPEGFELDNIERAGSISGGTSSSGTGYSSIKGAEIYRYAGMYSLGFYADFTLVNGGYDYISNVYSPWTKSAASNITYPELLIYSKNESISGPARAELRAQVDYLGIVGSETVWVTLNVGNNQAWVTSS